MFFCVDRISATVLKQNWIPCHNWEQFKSTGLWYQSEESRPCSPLTQMSPSHVSTSCSFLIGALIVGQLTRLPRLLLQMLVIPLWGSQLFLLFSQGDRNLFCHQVFCLIYLAIGNLFISAFCHLFSSASTDGSSPRILLSLWLLFPYSFLKISVFQLLQFQW